MANVFVAGVTRADWPIVGHYSSDYRPATPKQRAI